MVMGGSSGPELHSSLCSSSTSTCGMEQSWDQPGGPQHQLLQGYKLPVPKDLLPGQRRRKEIGNAVTSAQYQRKCSTRLGEQFKSCQ